MLPFRDQFSLWPTMSVCATKRYVQSSTMNTLIHKKLTNQLHSVALVLLTKEVCLLPSAWVEKQGIRALFKKRLENVLMALLVLQLVTVKSQDVLQIKLDVLLKMVNWLVFVQTRRDRLFWVVPKWLKFSGKLLLLTVCLYATMRIKKELDMNALKVTLQLQCLLLMNEMVLFAWLQLQMLMNKQKI